MTLPTLIIVAGPPGAGKTTLAHALARAISCPAVCRDEIKEGMARATPGYVPSPGDALTRQTFQTFFAVLERSIASGVTVVAEAAFRGSVWAPQLEHFAGRASLRVVACTIDRGVALDRVRQRLRASGATRAAHADAALFDSASVSGELEPLPSGIPTLRVDTTNGYRPGLEQIVAFVVRPTRAE